MNFTEVIYGIVSRFPKLLFLLVITSDQCSFHSLLFRIIQKQFHFREPNLTFWPFGIITSSPRHSHANYIYYSETHYSSGSRGRARGARPHPSFLDQTEARRAKKNFLRSAPPLSQGLNDRPPPPPFPPPPPIGMSVSATGLVLMRDFVDDCRVVFGSSLLGPVA